MNNKHYLDELSAYINGEVDDETRTRIQAHLAECSGCREEYESMNLLWTELAELPGGQPGESLRQRFYAMLNSYPRNEPEHPSRRSHAPKNWLEIFMPRHPALQFGFLSVALVIGILLGRMGQSSQSPDHEKEMVQLHEEIRDMNRLLTVSLLQQQSASERLRGVSMSYQTVQQDPEITDALLHTLKYDPNVNVRLAALDAIARSADQEKLRRELLQILPEQSSPLLQIAMVDLMVQAHEKQSLGIFKQMIQNPSINSSVKKKLQQGIQQLS
jgi:hypothetical protein